MADTFTTNLNLTKPEVGASTDTWGTKINADLDTVDAIFAAGGTAVHVKFASANFDDNAKAIFGTGDDLQIFHDGTDSYINSNGADLRLKADDVKIYNYAGTEVKAIFTTDGSVDLYHNNVKKFETSSTGGTVTGTLVATSLDISGDIDVDGTTNLDVVDIDGAVDMATTLAVAGTATFAGLVDAAIIDGVNFKVNGGQGSDGQVLTSTGSGVAWEDASGGVAGISSSADATAMTIDSSERVGIGTTSPTHQLDVEITSTNAPTARFLNKGAIAGYTNICAIDTYQSASVNHQYLVISSGNGGAISDNEFNFRGDGNAYADGSWNGGGADYAEYFEWEDGNTNNEDRVGHSVALINNKIKIAEDGDTIIGVISGNPSVVGDDAWNSWTNKYLKDDFGRYVLDADGFRTPNPNYDDTLTYVNRENRVEWDVVGLMGKLRIKKGQQTNPSWIKMQDISDSVEEWLVK